MNRIVDYLYLSDKAAARNARSLAANDIKLIVSIGCDRLDQSSLESFSCAFSSSSDGSSSDLNEASLKYLEEELTVVEYPYILDQPDVLISSIFDETFKIIHEFISINKSVLVHCVYGQSRSVAIVANYLMSCNRVPGGGPPTRSLEEALRCIRRSRPDICINPGFLSQLFIKDRQSYSRFKAEYSLASLLNQNISLIKGKSMRLPSKVNEISADLSLLSEGKSSSTASDAPKHMIHTKVSQSMPETVSSDHGGEAPPSISYSLLCKYCRASLCNDTSVLSVPDSSVLQRHPGIELTAPVSSFNELLLSSEGCCGEGSVWFQYPQSTSKVCRPLPELPPHRECEVNTATSSAASSYRHQQRGHSHTNIDGLSSAFVVAPEEWMLSQILTVPEQGSLLCKTPRCKRRCGSWKANSLALFHGYVSSHLVIINRDAVDITFANK